MPGPPARQLILGLGRGSSCCTAQSPAGLPAALVGAQETPLNWVAVAAAEPLDHRPHRGGVDDRQRGLQMVGEEAVKQHQVAPKGAEGFPAALHLGLKALHLGRRL